MSQYEVADVQNAGRATVHADFAFCGLLRLSDSTLLLS